MRKLLITVLATLFATSLYASKSISIDLSSQKIYAKENGRVVFSGNISSGKKGHATPTGNFRILEKDKFHISNKYPEPKGGAKMPYMLRLTNGGIAVHQGYVPGYPASHGCIRVPKSTALKLWRWSRVGTRVHVYGSASNFRYVKKHKSRKKRYAKVKKVHRVVKKVHKLAKTKVYKSRKKHIARVSKRVAKHYTKKRHIVKRVSRPRHYVRRDGYKIVEIYDSW